MGDEGMDPCECIWNHELAMRRLISLHRFVWRRRRNGIQNGELRQGQSYCTDSECLDELPGLPRAESSGGSFLTLFLVMALAVAMYVMRPRRAATLDDKPARHEHDNDGAPPTPPRI